MSVTDALDEDKIIALILEGSTQREIAESHGVSVGLLNWWIHATVERSARAREAMETSAEAWLDRGLESLLQAPPDTSEIARARAIEQHCARRAAIRNPRRYGDRTTLVGDPDAPLFKQLSDEQLDARIAVMQAKNASKD